MKFFSFWRSLASFRVRIALNLKGIEHEVVPVNLLKGEQRADTYRAVNPLMVIPSIVEENEPVLFELLAILEYLDETHPEPPLLPKDPRGRARVRGLAQIVACDAHPLIVPRVRNYLEHELKLDEPTRLKWVRHWFAEGYRALEAHLGRDKETGPLLPRRYGHARGPLSCQPHGWRRILRTKSRRLPDLQSHRGAMHERRRFRPRASA